MKKIFWMILLFFLIFLLVGCKKAPIETKQSTDALAIYDSGKIYAKDLDRFLMSLSSRERIIPKDSTRDDWFHLQIMRLIERNLIEASKEFTALDQDQDFNRDWLQNERLMLTRVYLAQFEKKFSVTEKEVQEFYNQNKKQLMIPEKRLVYSILLQYPQNASKEEHLQTRKKMTDLRQKIIKGASFDEMAREHSDSVTAVVGGSVGMVSRDQLRPDVAKVVFALSPGQISEIVENQSGCQIFMIRQITPAHESNFQSIKKTIYQKLVSQKQLEWINKEIQNELAEKELKFPDHEKFARLAKGKKDDVIIALAEASITVGDLRRRVMQDQPPDAALQQLLGELIFSKRMREEFSTQAESLIKEGKKRFALQWLLQKKKEKQLAEISDKALREYYQIHRSRFMTDPMIALTLYSWPIAKGDPFESMKRPRQFASRILEHPEQEEEIWAEFTTDTGTITEHTPLNSLRNIMMKRTDLVVELLHDIRKGDVLGPYNAGNRIQVVVVKEYEPPKMQDFEKIKAIVLPDFAKSNEIPLEKKRLQKMAKQQHLKFVQKNIQDYGMILLDSIMAGDFDKAKSVN